jgi:hypothetical protein
MNYKHIAIAFAMFLVGQIIVWVQVNGPLIWDWAKTYRIALMLLGVPYNMAVHGSNSLLRKWFRRNVLAWEIYIICSWNIHIYMHDIYFPG